MAFDQQLRDVIGGLIIQGLQLKAQCEELQTELDKVKKELAEAKDGLELLKSKKR